MNTYTTDLQFRPDVALDGSGDFVVVWESNGSEGTDNSGSSIQARRYSVDGVPAGVQAQVNTYASGEQHEPAVASGADGSFVVVWQGPYLPPFTIAGADTSGQSVRGQRFGSDGQPVGTEFQVNTYTTNNQRQPAVAVGGSGSFVVVWESFGALGSVAYPDTADTGIQAQWFASDGQPLGGEFQINRYTTGSQREPALAVDDNGNTVVVWKSSGSFGDDSDGASIQGTLLGSPLGQFQVNSTTSGNQSDPTVAMDPSGGFIVAWLTLDITLDDVDPVIEYSIRSRRFGAHGYPLGEDVEMVSTTTGSLHGPSLSIDGDGDVVATWESQEASPPEATDESRIMGRRYAADGSTVGGVFQVNSYTTGNQAASVVAAASDGSFVVAWQSDGSAGSDTDRSSVQARSFVVRAEIDGLVWLDEDLDGLQDAGEPGLADVPVQLVSEVGGTPLATEFTGADGSFLLEPKVGKDGVVDRAFLRYQSPRSLRFTTADVGGDDTIDSDADTVRGETPSFDIPSAGGQIGDLDAGLLNALGDRVWNDLDGDGRQDAGEPGVPGILVELFDDAGNQLDSTTTDGDGRFLFTALPTDIYHLAFGVPPGFVFTVRDQGPDDTDSDVHPATGTTPPFTFPLGGVELGWDAGIRSDDVVIGDRVWSDLDGDGVQDPGEPGVEGVTVTLHPEVAPPRGLAPTTVTDADGSYAFSAEAGFYYLEFSLPGGQAFVPRDRGASDGEDSDVNPASGTTVAFDVAPATEALAWDAGLEPATIGNLVWLDVDGDGRQGEGEPGLGGVTVRLLGAHDAVLASTTTDADGIYGFLGIPSGDYRVEVILPEGAQFSPRDVGEDELADSDVDLEGRTALFSYSAATGSRSHDAGVVLPIVFRDGFESGDSSAWTP